jgi:hypothetical protein
MLILFAAFLIYDNCYLEKGQSAIFYIRGNANYDWEDYTSEELESFERQCAFYMINLAAKLSQSWGWDFYYSDEQEPDFFKYRYDTLLIFFDGHGSYRNGNQYFLFEQESKRVDQISRRITCNNLTVIVNSCFSVNWHSEFTHDHLNSLFTNDLENKQTRTTVFFNPNSLQVTEMFSYNRFFLDFLYYGFDYSLVNSTAISYCYALNLTGIDA